MLAVIERLLAADGLLVIGHADRLEVSGVKPRFIAVEDPACFVYRLEARVMGVFLNLSANSLRHGHWEHWPTQLACPPKVLMYFRLPDTALPQ